MQQSDPAGFDFGAFDLRGPADEGYEIDIVHPATGKPFGATITIVGEHSSRFLDWKRRLVTRLQEKRRRAEKQGRSYEPSWDELQEELAQQAAVLTVGWKGVVENGQPAPFSEEAALRIYRKQDWLRDLVISESRVLGNFAPR